MPDRQSKEYLEMKKRFSLMERNMLSALQNINILTMEIERIRNVLAAKEGFEDLTEQQQHQHQQHQQQNRQEATEQPASTTTRRGPMSSSKGRTLKVINN